MSLRLFLTVEFSQQRIKTAKFLNSLCLIQQKIHARRINYNLYTDLVPEAIGAGVAMEQIKNFAYTHKEFELASSFEFNIFIEEDLITFQEAIVKQVVECRRNIFGIEYHPFKTTILPKLYYKLNRSLDKKIRMIDYCGISKRRGESKCASQRVLGCFQYYYKRCH